uniref:Uncharacterized protein n=1 Tax=Oryza brachyantha TaxID=4533 RepID=J3LI00_ORYBR
MFRSILLKIASKWQKFYHFKVSKRNIKAGAAHVISICLRRSIRNCWMDVLRFVAADRYALAS